MRMRWKREKGLTLIEVALAAMVTSVVMLSVWLQLQDMIKFYLSRNLSYTIVRRFDDVISAINSSCLMSSTMNCDKDVTITEIQDESSSGGDGHGVLNVRIKERTGSGNTGFDIWMTYQTNDIILSHIDKQSVINATSFYAVLPYKDVSSGYIQYYYSPVIPWSVAVSEMSWLVGSDDNLLIFHYFLESTA